MTEPKFTKGEWKAHVGIMEPDFVYVGEEENCDVENRVVCECYLRPGKGELSADVHLIAAAPEMYAVLAGLLEILNSVGFKIKFNEVDCREIIRRVLAKARGENE